MPTGAGGYDLVVSALVPYKRIELVLDAYRGTGAAAEDRGHRARRGAACARGRPPEVEFLGPVDDAALRELYRGCRAVIMPSVEDFGIVAVEAMACGRPGGRVRARAAARSRWSTARPGSSSASRRRPRCAPPLTRCRRMRFNTATLRARAETFSRPAFESRFRTFVDAALAEHAAASARAS